MNDCMEYEPEDRPFFSQIETRLQRLSVDSTDRWKEIG